MTAMALSAAGRKALESDEGLRLKSYRDSAGILTIGYGHTGRAGGPVVTGGMVITQADADKLLTDDVHPFEAAVNGSIHRAMTQNQFDAMVRLCFNIGAKGFDGSSVVRDFNAGETSAAADAFLLWNKAAGKVNSGLVARRKRERAMFLAADSLPVGQSHGIEEGEPPAPDIWGRIIASIFYVLFKEKP